MQSHRPFLKLSSISFFLLLFWPLCASAEVRERVMVDPSAQEIVLEAYEVIDMIAENDPEPWLRIYGDGRYVIYRPVYKKDPGYWEGRIKTSELERLAQSIADDGLLNFDPPAIQKKIDDERLRVQQKAAAGERVRLIETSDREQTRVVVRWISSGVAQEQEIVWWGLRQDALSYPHIYELRQFADLAERLRDLADGSLVRISGEEVR